MRNTISLTDNPSQIFAKENDMVCQKQSSQRRKRFQGSSSLREFLSKMTAFSCCLAFLNKGNVEFGARAALADSDYSTYTCAGGYYQVDNGSYIECNACPAGYACSGSSTNSNEVSCSSPQWSVGAAANCQDLPDGYKHVGSSSYPQACPSGQRVADSYTSCQACDDDDQSCQDPSSMRTNCSVYALDGYSTSTHCELCPAGSSCSGYDATACPSGAGSPMSTWMYPSAGSTCTAAVAGSALYTADMFPHDCVNSYNDVTNGPSSCGLCPAGEECTDPGSKASCSVATSESAAGPMVCDEAWDWYQTPGAPSGSSQVACAWGTYTNNCDECPEGSHCKDFDAAVTCIPGYFSELGNKRNMKTPLGKSGGDGSAIGDCTSNQYVDYYNKSTSGTTLLSDVGTLVTGTSCTNCDAGMKCSTSGVRTTCQAGEWCDTDGASQACTAGKECRDGKAEVVQNEDADIWAAHNAGNPQKYGCPHGYDCTDGIHTACASLEWSEWNTKDCEEFGYIWARDLGGNSCPGGTVSSSGHDHWCQPCDAGSCESSEDACGNTKTSWYEYWADDYLAGSASGCYNCQADPGSNTGNGIPVTVGGEETPDGTKYTGVVNECTTIASFQGLHQVPCDPAWYVFSGECHERDENGDTPHFTARDGSTRGCRENTVSDFGYQHYYRTEDAYCVDDSGNPDGICDYKIASIGTITGGSNHAFRVCMFCPLNAICPSSTSYEYAAPCYGKSVEGVASDNLYLLPYLSYKDSYPDAENIASGSDQSDQIVGLYFDDRRVQWARDATTTCLDCNSFAMKDGLCQFAAGYFPDHLAATAIGNIVNCPFQTVTRYVNKHSDYYRRTRADTAAMYNFVSDVAQQPWDTRAWFIDHWYDQFVGLEYHDQYESFTTELAGTYAVDTLSDDYNYHPYSYCKIDVSYFTPMVINTHTDENDSYYQNTPTLFQKLTIDTRANLDVDDGSIQTNVDTTYKLSSYVDGQDVLNKYVQECSLYEFRSKNYPSCRSNAPGFISPSNTLSTVNRSSPTESPVSTDSVFTRITQMGDFTGIIVVQCPEHASIFQDTGAIDEKQACRLKSMGVCETASSDYCHGGADFMCPPGWKITDAGGGNLKQHRDTACMPCPVGEACVGAATGTTSMACPDGYLCPTYTNSATHHPVQGGNYILAGGSETVCETDKFCRGDTAAGETCPDGYTTDNTLGIDNELGCIPQAVGRAGTAGNFCSTAGEWCSEGTMSAEGLKCPAGTFSSGGENNIIGCAANSCSDGSWCPEGSADSSTTCPAGFECPGGTDMLQTHMLEFPCPAGSWSTSGAGAGSCNESCDQGSLCREGTMDTRDNDAICAATGFLCGAGNPTRTQCPLGTYVGSDGDPTAGCAACTSGFACPGADRHACPIGYETMSPTLVSSDSENAMECGPCHGGTICDSQGTGYFAGTALDLTQSNWFVPGSSAMSEVFQSPPGWFPISTVLTPCGTDESGGFYCPVGDNSATAVGAGNISDEIGLFFQKPCPPGYICSGVAGEAPVAAVAGEYGAGGAATAGQTATGYWSAALGTGQYETACAIGTYTDTAGNAACTDCADGSYCFGGLQTDCPAGFYCVTTLTQDAARDVSNNVVEAHLTLFMSCPKGYYRTAVGGGSTGIMLDDTDSCQKADGGSAVTYSGATKIVYSTDQFATLFGAEYTDDTPDYVLQATTWVTSWANKCGAGYFCYDHSDTTIPNVFCSQDSVEEYKLDAAAVTTDNAGNPATCNKGVCPIGFFCAKGTTDASLSTCEPGKFTSSWGVRSGDECLNCQQGYFCSGATTREVCTAGKICAQAEDTGLGESNIEADLPQAAPGYFTETGYPAQIKCFPGTSTSGDPDAYGGTFTEVSAQAGARVDDGSGYLDCPVCANNYACPYFGHGASDNFPLMCEDATVSYTGVDSEYQVGWFVGRDCSAPSSYIMPLKAPYGYYIFQIADDASLGTGAKTECPEDMYCNDDGVIEPLRCPDGYKCTTRTTVLNPNIWPLGGYFQNWFDGQILGESCTECDVDLAESYETGYDGARSIVQYSGTQQFNDDGDFRLCQKGKYCDDANDPVASGWTGDGTAASAGREQDCPIGTYMPHYGALTLADCQACRAGYYCEATGIYDPITCDNGGVDGKYCPEGTEDAASRQQCTPGHYCPVAVHMEYNCALGQIAESTQDDWLTCDACEAGNYCIANTPADVEADPVNVLYSGAHTVTECPDEYYCPEGSSYFEHCDAGAKTPGPGATASSECQQIPYTAWQKMPTGYDDGAGNTYATKGTINDGIWADAAAIVGESDPFATLNGRPCPVGKWCTGGANQETAAGTYIDHEEAVADGPTCLAGYWCEEGCRSERPKDQDPDTYAGNICPSGWFCAAGSGATTGVQCAAGRYATDGKQGLQAAEECNNCPLGKVCANTDVTDAQATLLDGATDPGITDCLEGYYCLENTASDSDAAPCPLGHYCETGSVEALPCEKGWYQDATEQGVCLTCNTGSYCPFTKVADPERDGVSQETPCLQGHYCPIGGLEYPTPCPAGQFQPDPSEEACLTCTERFYCPFEGMFDLTGYECPDQHTCPAGTVTPALCEDGKWCSNSGSDAGAEESQTADGGVECPAGYFCKSGWREFCFAGYLCDVGGSDTPTPTSGAVGSECPAGYYCEEGVTSGTMCATGTYNSYAGGATVSACTACPSGFTCDGTPTIYPSEADCDAGAICGSTQVPCDPGYYCPQGALTMLFCPAGTYQPNASGTDCLACPAGSYCPQLIDSTWVWDSDPPAGRTFIIGTGTGQGASVTTDCPAGHYCPSSTSNYKLFPCPPGTFAAASSDTRSSARGATGCTPCTEGKVCPVYGMTDADDAGDYPCAPGFLCGEGSDEMTGTEDCPAHHWCPGAHVKTQCPDGMYSIVTGLAAEAECIQCPAGNWCTPNDGVAAVTWTACPEHTYCVAALSDVTAATACGAGNYCPEGSPAPTKCPPGTYSADGNSNPCTPCDAGSQCLDSGLSAPVACDANFWCPVGTISQRQCISSLNGSTPVGQYVSADSTQCLDCPTGQYCWPSTGGVHDGQLGNCLREADAGEEKVGGYLCREGSYASQPLWENVEYIQPGSALFGTYNGPVLPGYYVDAANGEATACAIKKWQPGFYTSECLDCYAGRYCPSTAMSDLADYKCTAGYICHTGNELATPGQDGVAAMGGAGGLERIGYKCDTTFQCPSSLFHRIECEDGFVSEEEGLAYCTSCPEGYYCDNGELFSRLKQACWRNSNCGGGDPRQLNCPNGLYYAAGECQNCTSPNYCRAGITAGPCAAGYQCNDTISALGRNSVPNPAGAECPAGTYCNRYDTIPTTCPWETMSVQIGAIQISDCTDCQPGFVCEFGNSTAYDCPIGHYCPPGGDNGIYNKKMFKCPRGTYNALLRRVYRYECVDCPPGYFCDEEGQSNYTANKCPLGHFCEPRAILPQPCPPGTYLDEEKGQEEGDCVPCINGNYCPLGTGAPIACTPGHYCPGGAQLQITCRGGFYCNDDSKYQEEECPVNFYCPRGSPEAPIPCDSKHTCPWRTEMQLLCPAGRYVKDNSRYGMQNECKECAPGQFSSVSSDGCEECPAGYVCYGETNTPTPTIFREHNGELCPKGHFCPPGTSRAVPCPRGFYSVNEGLRAREECQLCPAGTYNDLQGALGCKPCGKFATSEEGSAKCECIGRFRSYSAVDASCRCLSGYSFKNEDLVELGDQSATADCALQVRDRCAYGAGDADLPRDVEGNCVEPDDCGAACPAQPDGSPGLGTRSQTLGVCQCEAERPIDEICNQDCRRNAPQMRYVDANTIELVSADGSVERVDLTDDAYQVDVFGDFTCDYGAECDIKTIAFDENGPQGTYQPPSFIAEARRRRRLHELGHENVYNMTRTELRSLQADGAPAIVEQETILNPVYCISQGDSFLFTISSPLNYPMFMRESVMNTNIEFDYGAFLDLEISMKRKAAEGDTTESLFAFTFTQEGTYVFHDAAERQRILVITVKGVGEECADPDRYVQTVSGESLAGVGVQQDNDLLLRPNYPLIGAALGLLVFSTILVMCFFAYCLRHGWTPEELADESYKEIQLPKDLAHTREELFMENNDFENYKSELIDSDEDDLDNLNLDIQQELVEAGQHYIKMWKAKKMIHKRQKNSRRLRVHEILDEIDQMTNDISNDALENNMRWMDVDHFDEVDQFDDDMIREKVQKEIEAERIREEQEAEKQADQKEGLYQELSDRERSQFEALQAKMQSDIMDNKKELNALDGHDDSIQRGETQAYAIYDNGNANSKSNQLVKKIDLTQELSEEDRQRLLKAHEDNLSAVEDALAEDRRRQELELDRALKERLEKRKAAKKKINGAELQEELKDATDLINDEFGGRKAELAARLEDDNKNAQQEIYQAGLAGSDQAAELRELTRAHEDGKAQQLKSLEEERREAIESKKKEFTAIYLAGAKDDDELKDQLRDLLGTDEATMNEIISQTNKDKSEAENELQARLAERRAAKENKLRRQQSEFMHQLDDQDPEDFELIEQRNYDETKKLEAAMAAEDAQQDGGPAKEDDAFDVQSSAANQMSKALTAGTFGGLAKALTKKISFKQEEERKRIARDRHHEMTSEFDLKMASSSLMAQLAEGDDQLARDIAEEKSMQEAKLKQRRELLKARRKNKQSQAMEEQRIKDKIDLIEEEQTAKKDISEEYLRKLFARSEKSDEETKEEKQQRLDLLNEYLSDQFMERLSALLTKQFVEKEAKMKALVNKYMDDKIAESTSVKANFAIDYDKLEELKENGQLDEETYTTTKRQLMLKEQNLIRSVELTIEKSQKEEDALLKAEMEKKHTAEQIEFRKNIAEEQARLRKSLIADSKLCAAEADQDKKLLEKYAQGKQAEEAKKLKRIELQKKAFAGQIDAQIKDKYGNFDDMLQRQQKEKSEMSEATEQLKQKLMERKERLKMRPRDEGLTDEQKAALLNDYKAQLEQLDSAFDAEKARQRLVMTQKARQREEGLRRKREAKKKAEQEAAKAIAGAKGGMAKLFRQQTLVFDEGDEDSKLMQKLRQWKVQKKEHEKLEFQKKVQTTQVSLNDNQAKLMIMKLMKVERLMKELDQGSKKIDGRVDAIMKERDQNNTDRDSNSQAGMRVGSRAQGVRRKASLVSGAGMKKFGQRIQGML